MPLKPSLPLPLEKTMSYKTAELNQFWLLLVPQLAVLLYFERSANKFIPSLYRLLPQANTPSTRIVPFTSGLDRIQKYIPSLARMSILELNHGCFARVVRPFLGRELDFMANVLLVRRKEPLRVREVTPWRNGPALPALSVTIFCRPV